MSNACTAEIGATYKSPQLLEHVRVPLAPIVAREYVPRMKGAVQEVFCLRQLALACRRRAPVEVCVLRRLAERKGEPAQALGCARERRWLRVGRVHEAYTQGACFRQGQVIVELVELVDVGRGRGGVHIDVLVVLRLNVVGSGRRQAALFLASSGCAYEAGDCEEDQEDVRDARASNTHCLDRLDVGKIEGLYSVAETPTTKPHPQLTQHARVSSFHCAEGYEGRAGG